MAKDNKDLVAFMSVGFSSSPAWLTPSYIPSCTPASAVVSSVAPADLGQNQPICSRSSFVPSIYTPLVFGPTALSHILVFWPPSVKLPATQSMCSLFPSGLTSALLQSQPNPTSKSRGKPTRSTAIKILTVPEAWFDEEASVFPAPVVPNRGAGVFRRRQQPQVQASKS